ncbi:MAG: hypothetical protein K8T10_18805 [Candidatus Eremiobacteraeota bacterium]|nr:hypothetical protein [Candidatus Eremiobacteraeota bacterium]
MIIMKNYNFKKILVLILLILSLTTLHTLAAKKILIGKISSVNISVQEIVIYTDKGRKKRVKITKTTRLYKKLKPLPTDYRARLSQFKKGNRVYVISDNPESPTPIAKQVWGEKAYLVKNGVISSGKSYAGKVKKFSAGTKLLSLLTFDGKNINLKLTGRTRIIFDNVKGRYADIRSGTKVVANCRWPGFIEDRPATPVVTELIDSRTFVTRRYREKYGPVVAKGKVTDVNLKQKSIKVARAQGWIETIIFNRRTRWIPATPRIKSPVDFAGYPVYIFGSPHREKKSIARMVLNTMGLNTIFEALLKEGEIRGALVNIAFGDIVAITDNYLIVLSRGRRIKIRLTKKTAYFGKSGKSINKSSLERGHRVLIKGIFGNPSIALRIRSFGKITK